MRKHALQLLHLTTFNQFLDKKSTANQPKENKAMVLSYLLLANVAYLIKKDLVSARMEYKYKNMSFKEKAARVQKDFRAIRDKLIAGEQLSSEKSGSTHQFAKAVSRPQHRLDSRFLNKALIDAENCFIDVEANMSFGDLAKFALQAGYRIPMVPEFLSITVGGGFSGITVESSSFEHGLGHEHVLQAQVLMPDGSLKTLSPKDADTANEFFIFPHSNGTLGRVMRLRIPLIPLQSMHPEQGCHPYLDPARRQDYLQSPEPEWLTGSRLKAIPAEMKATEHVHLRYLRSTSRESGMAQLQQACENQEGNPDFIESVVLSPTNFVTIIGHVTRDASSMPKKLQRNYETRDTFWDDVNDSSLSESTATYMGHVGRWDQTVFWNTQQLGAVTKLLNNPVFRHLFKRHMGPNFLKLLSNAYDTYRQYTRPANTPQRQKFEHMVQDIGIPADRAAEFHAWYDENIHLYPLWLCPVSPSDGRFPSFAQKKEGYYFDFGMFTGKGMPENPEDAWHYTKLIEAKLIELGGIKTLYSDNALTRPQFNALLNTTAEHGYDAMKARMDSDGVFPHLYDKMVAAQHDTSRQQSSKQIKMPFSFEAYKLWTQCVSVAMVGSVIASLCLTQSMLGMAALGAASGAAAYEATRLMAHTARPFIHDQQSFASGISGWSSLVLLTSALVHMSSNEYGSLGMTAAMLAVYAGFKVLGTMVPAPETHEKPQSQVGIEAAKIR